MKIVISDGLIAALVAGALYWLAYKGGAILIKDVDETLKLMADQISKKKDVINVTPTPDQISTKEEESET